MSSTTEFASPAIVKLALEQKVRSFVGSRSTTDNVEMYVKAAAIMIVAVASYMVLVFRNNSTPVDIAALVVLALALVGIGFNIQHDGNHGGFSSRKWVNRSAGYTLDLIGASSYYWKQKHNLNHHTYTNIPTEDDDIEVGWFARMCDDHQWHWFHRYQQYYLWFLYAFVHVRYLYSDWRCLAQGTMNGKPSRRPTGGALIGFLSGKVAFLTLAFVIPMTQHRWSSVVWAFLAVSMIMGIIFSVVFQLAHTVDTVQHPSVKDGVNRDEWVIHQIQTTSNFGTNSRFLSVALGGLNFQREHHLFPKTSHVHYPALSRVVKAVCDEHQVKYAETPKLFDALCSHYRFLRQMGIKPVTILPTPL